MRLSTSQQPATLCGTAVSPASCCNYCLIDTWSAWSRRWYTSTFRLRTEPSVSEASNHTHPQLSEQKGFPQCALNAMMRNKNATIVTTSRFHITTRLLAGIINLSSYIVIKFCNIASWSQKQSDSCDLAEKGITCCGKQLELATRMKKNA